MNSCFIFILRYIWVPQGVAYIVLERVLWQNRAESYEVSEILI